MRVSLDIGYIERPLCPPRFLREEPPVKKIMFSAIALSMFAGAANAQVGAAVSADASNDNFLTETISSDYTIPGDMFGIRSVGNPGTPGLPFAIADDSAAVFPGDTQGIIDTNADFGRFFGVVDTVNGEGNDDGFAIWTFDVSGFTGLSVDIDFAAMGDFEDNGVDFHNFVWSIDGSPSAPLFSSSIDESAVGSYVMADGTPVALDDPMSINGTELTNSFQTLSAAISGTGATLTIGYTGGGDGGSEAFAFRNLVVNGIPTPGSVGLIGLAGLVAVRRRR